MTSSPLREQTNEEEEDNSLLDDTVISGTVEEGREKLRQREVRARIIIALMKSKIIFLSRAPKRRRTLSAT